MDAMNSPGPTLRPVTKHSSEAKRTFSQLQSDRIALLDQANSFVRMMVDKQVLPIALSGISAIEVPMTGQELATYQAALAFLERQFAAGHKDAEVVLTGSEQSQEYELGSVAP